MARYPSIKTLLPICDGDAELARKVRAYLQDESRGPHVRFERISRDLLNANHGYFGIEFAEHPGDQDRMIARESVRGFEFINTGDPYVPTLIFTGSGNFRVACWGDIVEKWPS